MSTHPSPREILRQAHLVVVAEVLVDLVVLAQHPGLARSALVRDRLGQIPEPFPAVHHSVSLGPRVGPQRGPGLRGEVAERTGVLAKVPDDVGNRARV